MWKRAYRREFERKQREGLVQMKGADEAGDRDGNGRVELVFRIKVVDLAREVVVEWVRGRDRVLWESLCGVVHRHFKKS